MFKSAIAFGLVAGIVTAQTLVDLRTQSKGVDFQAAPYTKPLKSGAALPPTCGVNELFFLTTAPLGSNVYSCNSVNTWSLQGGFVFIGGDVTGSSVTSVVQKLQTRPISAAAPLNGQALVWDGNFWVPQTISVLGGDASGPINGAVVTGLQSRAVSATAPQTGQALIWGGASWSGQTLPGVLGTISVENSSTLVGTRGVENFIAGVGFVNIITDTGTKINIQQNADTAVILSRATYQSGQSTLCKPASGSSSVYTCSMTPTLTGYQQGMVLQWQPDVSGSGGATTLQIDSLGAKPVKLADGVQDPQAGDIIAGRQYSIWFDGANFRIEQSPDSAVVLTRATFQSGQSALCKPSSGSGSVYTCAMTPTLTGYQQGMVLQWQPDVSGSGGATTLQIDSLGAKPVKLADGIQNPQSNDILAGRQYSIWFDGTNFRIEQSPDTAVLLTRATFQSGQSALCKPVSGSGSVYTCALTPTLTSYQQGMVLQWQPDVSGSGGATTLQIDSLGAKPVKLADGVQDPQAGDIAAGQQYSIWYDGTNFRLMAPQFPVTGSTAARPSCDLGHRGRIWQIFSATGIKDDVSVCAKDAANAYAWRVLY